MKVKEWKKRKNDENQTKGLQACLEEERRKTRIVQTTSRDGMNIISEGNE